MGRILKDRGVPEENLVLEPRALNTLQNAWEVLPLLPEGCREILLVTSDFHMPRAAYLFEAVLASRGLRVKIAQHSAESDCLHQNTGLSASMHTSAINAQTPLQRLLNEGRFLREEVVQIGLKEHIPGIEIPPLPESRMEQALQEVHMLLSQKQSVRTTS